jgi:hypothetical protein
MKKPFTSQPVAIALLACISLGLLSAEVGAGERVEFNQFNFGPLTTRALFPGVNMEGPGVQQTDWYPVYLWRQPSEQCNFYLDPPGLWIPFTDDHNLVTNVAPSDPTGVLHNLGCQLTVVAWGIYENESDAVPRMTNLTGNVPVYFVHRSDVNDYSGFPFNTMTWGDLQDLVDDGCALEGSAQLSEILRGDAPAGASGGAQVPGFKISLKGNLADGTPFSVHTVGQIVPSNPPGVGTVRTYKVKGLEDIDQQCQ